MENDLPQFNQIVSRSILKLCALGSLAIFCAISGSPGQELPAADPPAKISARLVALTFDDGPSIRYTPQILDILAKDSIKATFFVIGKNVQKRPEILKRIVSQGHQIGNHTWSHPTLLPFASHKEIKLQLLKTESIVDSLTSIKTHVFRPPHGWESRRMVKCIVHLGYTIVNWTIDPNDWKHPSPRIITKRISSKMHACEIVLLHDGLNMHQDPMQENTIVALPFIIAAFKDKGYRFVTIDELLAQADTSQSFRLVNKCIQKPYQIDSKE